MKIEFDHEEICAILSQEAMRRIGNSTPLKLDKKGRANVNVVSSPQYDEDNNFTGLIVSIDFPTEEM